MDLFSLSLGPLTFESFVGMRFGWVQYVMLRKLRTVLSFEICVLWWLPGGIYLDAARERAVAFGFGGWERGERE